MCLDVPTLNYVSGSISGAAEAVEAKLREGPARPLEGAHMPGPRCMMLASEGGNKDSSHVTTASKRIGHGCLYLKKMLTTAAAAAATPIDDDQSQVVYI